MSRLPMNPVDATHRPLRLESRLRDLEQRIRVLEKVHTANGTATMAWPGATSRSNEISVPHGLGVVPSSYGGVANDDTLNVGIRTADATNLYIRVTDVNGTVRAAGSAGAVLWWARV